MWGGEGGVICDSKTLEGDFKTTLGMSFLKIVVGEYLIIIKQGLRDSAKKRGCNSYKEWDI